MNEKLTPAEQLARAFPDPEVNRRLVNALTNKRPPGWGNKSHATYYKQYYGEQLKDKADEMMVTKQAILFDYHTFCYDPANPHRTSEKTLYLRVNQSLNFLLNELDKDGKYARWKALTRVRVDRKKGVFIEYVPELLNALDGSRPGLQPRMVVPEAERPVWRNQLDEWLQDPEDFTPFVKENLIMSPDEQEQLRAELAGLTNIIADVTHSSVKIVKFDPSQLPS